MAGPVAAGDGAAAPRSESSGSPGVSVPPATAAPNGVAAGAAAATPAAPPASGGGTNTAAGAGQPVASPRGGSAADARPTPANRAGATPAGAARAERPRPVTEGRLQVRSTPAGARVTLDGRNAGVTPATLTNLSEGAHIVRVSRDGYVTAERRVRIRAAQTSQSIDVTLAAVRAARPPAAAASKPVETPPPAAAPTPAAGTRPAGGQGALVVDSRPAGARVFVDGRQVGVTPLQLDSVDAGSHAVRLELEGFGPWATTVQVVRGQRARVSGSLER